MNKQLGLFDAPPVEKEVLPPHYVVLDFETGGFNEKECGLCSVGIILLDKNLEECYRTVLTLYEPGKRYEEGALKVNGFTEEQLQRDGMRPETFIPLLHQLVDKYVMVNHNGAFDCNFLNARGWSIQESVDTMVNDIAIAPSQKHKLGMVYNRLFGHDFARAHNALADVEATCEVLRWQVKRDPKYGQAKPIVWDRYKR
jgi:DNA polymerase III alpha subunit (gram-positive type)